MKKGEKFGPSGSADKEKSIVEEKGKRTSRHTRIKWMSIQKPLSFTTKRRWINTWPSMAFVEARG